MKTLHFFTPLFALGLLVSAHLYAAETKYLPVKTPDALTLLPPPPSAGSLEARTELDTAYRIYSAATPEELARGESENELTIFHFASVIGPWFQPGKFPKTEALFKEVETEARSVTSVGKSYWKRLRPYNADPALFPHAIEHEERSSYSYPSGHSTRGTTYAYLLAELFPEKREQLLETGRDCGWLRVQGGAHFPSDVYAGRVLGQALARAFLQSPAFQHDLAEAKAEIAAGKP